MHATAHELIEKTFDSTNVTVMPTNVFNEEADKSPVIRVLCHLLQTSCIVFIRQCHEKGLINDEKKEDLENYIMEDRDFCRIHEQIKALVPKQLEDGDDQAAYLRAIVSRVRFNYNSTYNFLDCKLNGNAVKGTRLLASDLEDDLLG